MWTQRDQIQAYQFLRRRLVSALVSADANHPTSPSKRLVLGAALGLVVTLLTAAVFGIIGALSPSRADVWRQGGQVIVEQESGALFVLGVDDTLHPVLNYASARLLAGGDGTKTVVVPAKSLSGAPRGYPVGLPGAPDSLPGPTHLLTGPWTRCTRNSPDRPSGDAPISTVLLGQTPPGAPLTATQGVLVHPVGDQQQYLITDQHRYLLADARTVAALGYQAVDALAVSPQWLNTVPPGRDLRTIDVPGAGSAGPTIGGRATKVGQVLAAGGEQYVVHQDGVVVVTDTEARLMLGSRSAASAYPRAVPRVLPAAAGDMAVAPHSGGRATGYPQARPEPVPTDPTSVVCTTGTEVTVGPAAAELAGHPVLTDPKAHAATEVSVPGGGGALVSEQPRPGASTGTLYLITDTGQKYPVPGQDALSALGYDGQAPQGVPADVLALFPTGVTLSAEAAARTST